LAATGFPQAVASATYDVANELTNWNGTTINYDANGNMQNDGAASYTWNGRNQLIGRGTASFQYDSNGRRTMNAAGNNLFYEGADAAQELSGTTAVANRILGTTDQFFTRADSTGTYSPITDALGSVLALTNASGNMTTQYGYDPFGNTVTAGTANTNSSQYTGRENDGNGLYYYRARYYSPQFGRFVSQDPIGLAGGINHYVYAGNSPTNFRDPFGMKFDFWNNPLMNAISSNANYLPGICEGGLFNFTGGGVQGGQDDAKGFYGAFSLQDVSISMKGRKPKFNMQYSEGTLFEGGASAGGEGPDITGGAGAVYEPTGSSGFALTEGFGFGGTGEGAEIPGVAGVDAGVGGLAGYAPGHGIVLGFYGEAEGWAGNPGAFGAYGAGAYVALNTAANCVN
jgi:RHS repeat-associated protein